jgi:hypothetical protein
MSFKCAYEIEKWVVYYEFYESEMLLNRAWTWKQKNVSFIAWSMSMNIWTRKVHKRFKYWDESPQQYTKGQIPEGESSMLLT